MHFDRCPDDPFRPLATPIYQTASFEQESAEAFSKYDYSRSGNPTRAVLETQLAELEEAERAFAFASGMAALAAVTRLLKPGDEILAADDLYGGTFRLFSTILLERGIVVRYIDLRDARRLSKAISRRTRLVHVETPSNPLLRVYDLPMLATIAHDAGLRLSVDGTAMTPLLQRPLELGADVVIHSATKYLSGHGDVTAGVVAVRDAELAKRLYLIQNAEGAALGPFDSYLLLRGLKTLSLRLERQQATAQCVAEHLVERLGASRVYYPGLATHEGARVHARQASGAGALLSVDLGSLDAAARFAEALELFPIAVSFGSVGSTCVVPTRMSHASVPPEIREKRPLPEGLVRLSIGIEDAADLIADIDRAWERTEGKGQKANRKRERVTK